MSEAGSLFPFHLYMVKEYWAQESQTYERHSVPYFQLYGHIISVSALSNRIIDAYFVLLFDFEYLRNTNFKHKLARR